MTGSTDSLVTVQTSLFWPFVDSFFLSTTTKTTTDKGGEESGGSGKSDQVTKETEDRPPSRNMKESTEGGTAPESPSKQLPDQISFFSGNPSVEIVHGIMHLYKTKWVLSLPS